MKCMNENKIFSPWENYLLCDDDLPETPQWNGTAWNECFNFAVDGGFPYIASTTEKMIYKVKDENSVMNIGPLVSYGTVLNKAANNKSLKCFRLKWVNDCIDQYIQWFSSESNGLENLNICCEKDAIIGTKLPLKSFFMLKDSNNEYIPYFPSLEDTMAEDWVIHEFSIEDERKELVESLTAVGCEVIDLKEEHF